MISGLVSYACDHYITLNKLGLLAIIQNTALTLLGNLPEQCFETNASSVPYFLRSLANSNHEHILPAYKLVYISRMFKNSF